MIHTIIMGEPLCYLVQSESNNKESYRVDLVEGECGCRDWVCRHSIYQRETGKPYRCKHIVHMREIALNDIIEHIKEQTLTT